MEQKINIAELLKDCPSGMELDCAICDNVYFDEVTPYGIRCYIKNDIENNTIYFHKDGSYLTYNKAKCVIYPKGKTTWEGFHRPFKDGDVIANNTRIVIFHKLDKVPNGIRNDVVYYHCWYHKENNNSKFKIDFGIGYASDFRFATEEEKAKLFKAIKDYGYRWNEETKTLEKLPKFKVGDIIKAENPFYDYKIIKITDTHYTLETIPNALIHNVEIYEDKNWKLIPNKFDISTLKPFESRVLVRTGNRKWVAAFYGHYDKDSSLNSYLSYCVVGGLWYEQCIPYEGNEHLLNTTDDCNEFYKNW